MELLKSHRSIRKYKTTNIPDDVLADILECGIRSSNTGNMQLYSIIVTRSTEKKALLAPLHFNQPMVMDAPVVLTICYDFNRFSKWCSANNTKADFSNLLWLLNGTIDSSILSQNICVAAESKGLGICYIGTTLYNAPEISKVLHLPAGVIPITTLTIGYPEQIPELTDRLPLDSVVHFEEYEDYSKERIAEIYQEKENLESSQQFVKENGKENLAQVYTEVRYKSADSEFFTAKLKQLLEDQAFS
ncbi:MAG TPA: nitroreductase family protein [Prolixibacteraceae bacterium]|nr:nitroreductase family protein [Prolixibacteraceae bacterium]